MAREILSLSRMWSANVPNREQVWEQNEAEALFDHACERAKMLGIQIAKLHRSMRQTADEDGTFPRMTYSLSVAIEGTPEALEYFKGMLDHQLPPPVEAPTEPSPYYRWMEDGGGVQVLVRCCFCPGAFTARAMGYRNTAQYIVERNLFCPHCRTRIVQGKALVVLPTTEEGERDEQTPLSGVAQNTSEDVPRHRLARR